MCLFKCNSALWGIIQSRKSQAKTNIQRDSIKFFDKITDNCFTAIAIISVNVVIDAFYRIVDEIMADRNNLMTHNLSGSMCQESNTLDGTYFTNSISSRISAAYLFAQWIPCDIVECDGLLVLFLLPLLINFLVSYVCKCHTHTPVERLLIYNN